MGKNKKVVGYCRICGKLGDLTEDHVPPRKCGNDSPVYVYNSPNSRRISQKGATFTTICEECNSGKLGRKYDPELIKLFRESRIALSEKIEPPSDSILIDINPKLLLRSVSGHLLSSEGSLGVTQPANSAPFYSTLRNYVMDESFQMEGIEFFYWFYHYKRIKIVHFMGMLPDVVRLPGKALYGAFFKFRPIGIWIVYKRDNVFTFPGLSRIPPNEEHYRVALNKKAKRGVDWPEFTPDPNGCSLFSSKGIEQFNIK